MKKKMILSLLLIVALVTVTGCGKKEEKKDNKAALEFKEEYESLNGKTNASGKEHRTITISEDNPYIKVTPSKIVEMIENNETFYLYVGDPLCPWCRSVLEKSIEVAKKNNIEKIYYIDIWDEDGKEILRDKYEVQDGKAVKVQDGTEEYEKLLGYLEDTLRDYTLTDGDKTIETGEKRIYAPNYFKIVDGEAKLMISGKSEKQTDAREKLTDEMLEDEVKEFEKLFK